MSRLATFLLCLLLGLPATARASAASVPDPDKLVGCYISLGCWNPSQADQQFRELSDNGVNFVIDYALHWPQTAAEQDNFDAYLAIAGREGITVAYCLFNALKGATPRASSVQVRRMLAEVEALKDKPQIGAWYVHDEVLPMLSGVDGTENYSLSLGQMKDIYDSIRRIDPQRPQVSVWNLLPSSAEMNRRFSDRDFPHGMPEYLHHEDRHEQAMQQMLRETCDWVMVDCYPYGAHWLDDSHSTHTITSEVEKLVRRAVELKDDRQPLLFVYQSFDWRIYGRGADHADFPTSDHMWAMIESARSAGADNVLAYSWFDLVRPVDGVAPARQAMCLDDLKQVMRGLASGL